MNKELIGGHLLLIPTDDASRVVLSVPDVDGSDYINASYIDVCIYNQQTCISPLE